MSCDFVNGPTIVNDGETCLKLSAPEPVCEDIWNSWAFAIIFLVTLRWFLILIPIYFVLTYILKAPTNPSKLIFLIPFAYLFIPRIYAFFKRKELRATAEKVKCSTV